MFDRIRKAAAVVLFVLSASAFAAPKVAVVAHEPGYYTSLANHVGRWLKGEGIESSVVAASGMKASLATAKVAFVIGFNEPSAGEVAEFTSFVKRGGRLVVFYTASPALANLMGVKVLGYKTAHIPAHGARWTSIRQPSRDARVRYCRRPPCFSVRFP